VIVAVGLINIVAWGIESCCQHLAKTITAVRKLRAVLRRLAAETKELRFASISNMVLLAITRKQFQQLQELVLRRRWDWPAVVSTEPRARWRQPQP
jgi:hypothetical protein